MEDAVRERLAPPLPLRLSPAPFFAAPFSSLGAPGAARRPPCSSLGFLASLILGSQRFSHPSRRTTVPVPPTLPRTPTCSSPGFLASSFPASVRFSLRAAERLPRSADLLPSWFLGFFDSWFSALLPPSPPHDDSRATDPPADADLLFSWLPASLTDSRPEHRRNALHVAPRGRKKKSASACQVAPADAPRKNHFAR